MNRRKKKYAHMDGAELAEATKKFDEDFAFLKGRALTAEEKRLHAAARRRGRPRVGEGAEKIRVSVERGLLREADAFARKRKMSRSEMIARGLRAAMSGAA